MTDEPMSHDEALEALRRLGIELPPLDVTQVSPPTRHDVQRLRSLTGAEVSFVTQGEPYEDGNGVLRLPDPMVTTGQLGGVTITKDEATRLGLTQHGDDGDPDA